MTDLVHAQFESAGPRRNAAELHGATPLVEFLFGRRLFAVLPPVKYDRNATTCQKQKVPLAREYPRLLLKRQSCQRSQDAA